LVNQALRKSQLGKEETKLERPFVIIINLIDDIKQGDAFGLQAKYGNVKLVETFRDVMTQAAY
jgi:hypothetical protein